MNARTYLFVPGNRPERFAKALASGADAVVLDLEDAVATEAKGAARDAIAAWCATAVAADCERIVVRINDAASALFEAVAVKDPKMPKFVVVISRNVDLIVGQLLE